MEELVLGKQLQKQNTHRSIFRRPQTEDTVLLVFPGNCGDKHLPQTEQLKFVVNQIIGMFMGTSSPPHTGATSSRGESKGSCPAAATQKGGFWPLIVINYVTKDDVANEMRN